MLAHSPEPKRLPAARGLVPRRPLFEQLSSAGQGDIVLVCAPAGSGKTLLLRAWIDRAGLADRVAWVSVERGERDAQRFWLSVIDALSGADSLVERVAATPAFGGKAVLEQLLSDLHMLVRPVVLVIDDLHELRSTTALQLLEALLSERPRELRVVLATREDPGLGLHRMRLARTLIEIRGSDLRFSLAREQVLPLEVSAWAVQTQVLRARRTRRGRRSPPSTPKRAKGPGMRLAAAALVLRDGSAQEAVNLLSPVLADAPGSVADGRPPVLDLRRATVHALLLDDVARDALDDLSGPKGRSSARSGWPNRTG